MLDPKLERILNQVLESARSARYEFVSLEHVLLAMSTKDEETIEILEACGANLSELKRKLERHANRKLLALSAANLGLTEVID